MDFHFYFQAVGGFIAVALMVIGAIFDIIGKFIAYYGFLYTETAVTSM